LLGLPETTTVSAALTQPRPVVMAARPPLGSLGALVAVLVAPAPPLIAYTVLRCRTLEMNAYPPICSTILASDCVRFWAMLTLHYPPTGSA
jgi:hypothetical protein